MPTQVTAFRVGTKIDDCVLDPAPPKEAPALIRFTLNQATNVTFCYELANNPGVRIPLTKLFRCEQETPVENSTLFDAGTQTLLWNFDEEQGLDQSLNAGIRICALLSPTDSLDDSNSTVIDLGNDPPRVSAPRILNQTEDGEVSGDAPIRFLATDSSEDIIRVRIEYAIVGPDPPLFLPVKDVAQSTTPEFAISGVQARREEEGGTEIIFIWDSDAEPDLIGQELPVLVRLTPSDTIAVGEPLLISGTILIDNNLPPTVILDRTSLEITLDDEGGIPLPFRIRDPESDPVTVILQWATPGTSFPELPDDPAALANILTRPMARKQLQIASEIPAVATGRIAPAPSKAGNNKRVRLPELATTASWLVNAGGPGPMVLNRELEILRSSLIPGALDIEFTNPVTSLPSQDGLDAFVLNRTDGKRWEILLATLSSGQIVTIFDSLTGPSDLTSIRVEGMAFDQGNRRLLQVVGFSEDLGEHRLIELRLEKNESTGLEVTSIDLLAKWKSSKGDRVHGLASGTGGLSWVTTGNSILTLHHANPGEDGFAETLLSGLLAPRGLAVDALSPTLFVAENDSGRILRIDPNTRTKTVLADGPDLSRPDDICLEGLNRLLVLTDNDLDDGTFELRAIPLRLADPGISPIVSTITTDLAGTATSLSCGADSLRLVTLATHNRGATGSLAVGGGVLERRSIRSYDPGSQIATVSEPFSIPVEGLPWRIADRSSTVLPEDTETSDVFVWDSREKKGDRFDLRLTAFDSDPGTADVSSRPVPRRLSFEVEPTVVVRDVDPNNPRTPFPEDLVVEDLDGDGDLDLATANVNEGRVTVFYQADVRNFTSDQLNIDAASDTQFPRSLASADLDGDSLQDLVLASCTPPFASLLRQSPVARTWDTSTIPGFQPSVCFPSPIFSPPIRILTADLDRNTLSDLVFIVPHEQRIVALSQIPGSPGTFEPHIDLDLGVSPLLLEIADIDRDGQPDALVAIDGGILLVTKISGPAPIITRIDLAPGSEIKAVRSASFDEDGLPDLALLVNANGNATITILHQSDNGTFDPLDDNRHLTLPLGEGRGLDLVVTDFDLDGDFDLVFVIEDELGVFFQEGTGTFSESARREFVCGGNCNPLSLVVRDVDGDGILDVLIAVLNGVRINIFWGRSCSDFSASRVAALQGDDKVQTLVTADLDGDGDLECAVPSSVFDRVSVFRQVSPGRFSDEPVVLTLPPGSDPLYIEAGDLNGDGRADIVTGNTGTDSVTVFLQTQQGEQEFFTTLTSLDIQSINDLGLADVNGDGRLDISLSTSGSPGFVGVFLQEAMKDGHPPVFGRLEPINATLADPGPAEFFFVDFDLDGALDLVTSYRDPDGSKKDRVEVLGQRDGIFERESVLQGDFSPDRIRVGHLDEGGFPGLVVAGESAIGDPTTLVFWRLCAGDPLSFQLVRTETFTGTLVTLDIADVDCDGRDDVAIATGGPDAFFLLLPRTPTSFQRITAPIVTGSDLINFRLTDMDGDSEPDVVGLYGSRGVVEITFGGR